MLPDQPVTVGFDASADGDLTLVVLRRDADGDHWQVEQVEGPENPDLSRVVARIVGDQQQLPPPRRSEDDPDGLWLSAETWMVAHSDITFQLTDEQRELVRATFARLVAEGKIRLR